MLTNEIQPSSLNASQAEEQYGKFGISLKILIIYAPVMSAFNKYFAPISPHHAQ
jgi:hypothetical protein